MQTWSSLWCIVYKKMYPCTFSLNDIWLLSWWMWATKSISKQLRKTELCALTCLNSAVCMSLAFVWWPPINLHSYKNCLSLMCVCVCVCVCAYVQVYAHMHVYVLVCASYKLLHTCANTYTSLKLLSSGPAHTHANTCMYVCMYVCESFQQVLHVCKSFHEVCLFVYELNVCKGVCNCNTSGRTQVLKLMITEAHTKACLTAFLC